MQVILQYDNYPTYNFLLIPENFGQEGGKFENFEHLKKQKVILGGIKSIFHNFVTQFFCEM